MSIIDIDNVKIDSYLNDNNQNNVKKNKIDVEKIKQLKKDSKKKYIELLHILNNLYKLQTNKQIGDILITLESLKNNFNLN